MDGLPLLMIREWVQIRVLAVLIGVLLLIVVGAGFSVYLGARLAAPVPRRVAIAQGESFQLTLPADKVYKVEACETERDCLTIAWRARGPGPVALTFPTAAPVGQKMFLKVSERRANGTLGSVVRSLRQAFLVRAGSGVVPPPTLQSSDGGGGASAGGAGGAGGGSGINVSNVRFVLDAIGGDSWTLLCWWDTSPPSIVETMAQARANGGEWLTWHGGHDSTWLTTGGTPQRVTPHTQHGCPAEATSNRFRGGDVIEARIVTAGGGVLAGPRSATAPSVQYTSEDRVEF